MKLTMRVVVLLGQVLSGKVYTQISSEDVERRSNARAAALADAIVADASDASSMYWNPSLLPYLTERSVVINYSLERIHARDNIMNENVVIPMTLDREWSIGLGATYSHVGHIEEGSSLSGYDFNETSVDVALANVISRSVTLGIISSFRFGHTGSENGTAWSAGAGITYYPLPEISYGLSFQGIGEGIGYLFDATTLQTTVVKMNLAQSLQLGVTLKFNVNRDRPSLVITGATQKIFGVSRGIYKGGVEAWPVGFLALRAGYWIGTQTVAARYGMGIRMAQWQVDYAISTTELEPQFHQVSLSYCFDSRTH